MWLETQGREFFSKELKNVFHLREAEFFDGEFKRTKNVWMAINASAHYRKCSRAAIAHSLLSPIEVDKQTSQKLKSALCTTYGGVQRDLENKDTALELGHKAHQFEPDDFRPCTLLGAVNMEIGKYGTGQAWYEKAESRGATRKNIDAEMRSIFNRADKNRREGIKAFLLKLDPARYKWVN